MATAPFRVKAVFEYTSSHEDDLAFKVGQIITVTDEEDSEWYGGEYVDEAGVKQEGIFPRNFVEKFEPTAPPRPTRARKKEAEPISLAPSSPPPIPTTAAPPEPPPVDEALAETTPGDIHEEAPPAGNTHPSEAPPVPVANPPEIMPVPALAPIESKDVDPVGSASIDAPPPQPEPSYTMQPRSPPPVPSQFSLPPNQPRSPPPASARSPPPVSQKPSSNSFRDRIAAFNKPAAPPVAPFKPSGLGSGSSGFIKKPFVAPPPSRHAFVPPPRDNSATRVHRGEKGPETQEAQAGPTDTIEKAAPVPTASSEPGDEDQPKPTTLKERIALLQKQQAEAAQRHAEALAKKEKPARPPKKPMGGNGPQEATASDQAAVTSPPLERKDPHDAIMTGKESLDNPRDDNGSITAVPDTGDITARPEVPVQHSNNEDHLEKQVSQEGTVPQEQPAADGEEADEEEEDDIDPEVRRKEELRARMAKMSGGMGMAGMFGPPGMMGLGGGLPPRKPKPPMPERRQSGMAETPPSPMPARIALPGLGIQKQPEETSEPEPKQELAEDVTGPLPVYSMISPETESTPQPSGAPPVPGGRPAPPPIPTDSRPPPPPPPAAVASPSVGSESDDEMSENTTKPVEAHEAELSPKGREPPRVPMTSPPLPTSPRFSSDNHSSNVGEASPASPSFSPQQSKRISRPPPPIPGAAPSAPLQTRPPPPPPPATIPSRTSTANEPGGAPMEPGQLDNGEEREEATEYDGDYDTDITSSAHHKDALKAHTRGPSLDGSSSMRSPAAEYPSTFPPPVPSNAAPRTGPPPVPSQPAPPSRGSIDVPRAAPPPPPSNNDDYDPYNYNTAQTPPAPAQDTPAHEEKEPTPSQAQAPAQPLPLTDQRAPPMSPPTGPRVPPRKSADILRPAIGRRSVDVGRHSISMETGFMANEIDLSSHTQWWLSGPGVPPVFQGRKDIHTESTEAKSTEEGREFVTKEIFILFPDYSQTMITVRFNTSDSAETELDQRHEPPPRPLRQDELEEAYERFGRQLAQSAASKKDTIVGDGTPNAFLYDLLQPLKGALPPVGTRAYGALVYANLANAATQLNDEIRPGDIISIRNAKFQGKHGPMHARYTMEVGKPDHVAIVAEWDGTKKKVRAWEQGRENKKVKQESFKLEDLRSGEVKIWRVMPRTWVGWELKE